MDRETELYILNLLRKGTLQWSGRAECLRRARKKVKEGHHKNGKEIFKYHWQCAKCRQWFRSESDMEVDHIEEVGPYKGNLTEYAQRMYCSLDNLQALCIVCHSKKTSGYNASLMFKRKK